MYLPPPVQSTTLLPHNRQRCCCNRQTFTLAETAYDKTMALSADLTMHWSIRGSNIDVKAVFQGNAW